MKILVTGGAGAIGSYLTRFLEAQGHQVIIIDDMSSGFDFNISDKASFYKADISSKEEVAAVFKEHDFDVIYHLAAFFANQNSVDHPVRDLEVNGIGTLNVLDQALKQYKEGKLKHFLFASSSCVYGMCSGAINETQAFSPETPYAITKILGERYIDFY
ncbi:MAG: NAD-dependent epimerase/dehydratase family protein, partial [Owenweeksia sp.]